MDNIPGAIRRSNTTAARCAVQIRRPLNSCSSP